MHHGIGRMVGATPSSPLDIPHSPRHTHPPSGHTHPHLVLTSSGCHRSGRYAPHWNAFLFFLLQCLVSKTLMFVYSRLSKFNLSQNLGVTSIVCTFKKTLHVEPQETWCIGLFLKAIYVKCRYSETRLCNVIDVKV